MERWLVLSNCMTLGLANSLSLMHPGIVVDAADIHLFRQYEDRYRERLRDYSRLVVNPAFVDLVTDDRDRDGRISLVPGCHFEGFHPDICVCLSEEEMLVGRMGHYHSLIAIAAYSRGMTVRQTMALYNRRTYEDAGYFALWNSHRDMMIGSFAHHGIDIRASFLRWASQRQAFMFSMNHPRIEVIYDIAHALLTSLGIAALTTDLRPPDNLVNGPCYPIFPEIAEERGVTGGSYLFKPMGEFRLDTLERFLTDSFNDFARCPAVPVVAPEFEPRYRQVLAAIGSGAA